MKEETKKKLSEALKRFCSQEGFVSWHKGKKHTEETKRKISEANKIALRGKKLSEETKKKISEANKGRVFTQETRTKISKSLAGKHPTDETRQKMSINSGARGRTPWNKGIACTEESKQKVSESQKKRYLNGVVPWNKNMTGYHVHSEEHKKELSELMKGNNYGIGIVPWNKGKPLPDTLRKKLSEVTSGEKHWNFGKHLSEETRNKISAPQKGDKSKHWKGGRKITWARTKQRRKGLDFILLNDPELPTWEGHHLDKEHVLYIPKEIHKKYIHKLSDSKSMDRINNIVIEWYIKYYGLQ